MKKIIALLLAIFMLLSLCACGNDQNDTSNDLQSNNNSSEKGEEDTVDLTSFETLDDVMNYLATFIDTSKYGNDDTPELEDYDRRELLVKEPTQMANEITVSGKLIKFPLSYDVSNYCITGYEEFNKAIIESADDVFRFDITDKDGKEFGLSGTSFDNIEGIDFLTYDEDDPQFEYMKKITNKATPKNIVEILGLPQTIKVNHKVSATGLNSHNEITFYYRDEGEKHELQIEFSSESYINGMRYFSYRLLKDN